MKRYSLIVLVVWFVVQGCTTQKVNDIDGLLEAMYERYEGVWFTSFSFSQETIRYDSAGAPQPSEIWYEAVQYPSNFRIDFDELGSRKVIFVNDSSYNFQDNFLISSRYNPQEFLLFKGGMYVQPIEETKEKLTSYGYDLSIFREDTLNGRPAYAIGAEKGDLVTKQFWIDKEHFYTVRRISPRANGEGLDVQYGKHKRVGGGWVEEEVRFFSGGRLIQDEIYFDTKLIDSVNPNMFSIDSPVESLQQELGMEQSRNQ